MSNLILSAHQPNFLPYLGFFDKMLRSDIFVIRDEVLFTDSDFHHRNKIRINGNDNINNPQFKWLTIPVVNSKDYIKHILIKKNAKIKNFEWNKKLIQDIKANYKGSAYFDFLFPRLKEIFNCEDEMLIDLNMKIIMLIKNILGIKTKIIMASELGLRPGNYTECDNKTEASRDLTRICTKLGANVYLSGDGGRDYLDMESFESQGIEVKFQDYKHPIYRQKYPGFLPYMSAIDALFCLGKMFKLQKEEQICYGIAN